MNTPRDEKHQINSGLVGSSPAMLELEAEINRAAAGIIEAPPLRKHAEDIPELARSFLEQFAGRDGKDIKGFTEGAISLLVRHPWPGNVRQMQNVIDRALGDLVANGGVIDERLISRSFEKENVFGNLAEPYAKIGLEPSYAIASLVFDDLVNSRIPLEGIKNRSQSTGALAECLINGFETGFKQFLETDRGQKLLRGLNSSDLLSRAGLSSRRGGSNALFISRLRGRLTAVIEETKPVT